MKNVQEGLLHLFVVSVVYFLGLLLSSSESFLTYYSKSDLQAARGLSSERLGSISAWDLRDGHWTYPKAKVFIRRSDKHNRDCVLENFASDFYDAMLICLW